MVTKPDTSGRRSFGAGAEGNSRVVFRTAPKQSEWRVVAHGETAHSHMTDEVHHVLETSRQVTLDEELDGWSVRYEYEVAWDVPFECLHENYIDAPSIRTY